MLSGKSWWSASIPASAIRNAVRNNAVRPCRFGPKCQIVSANKVAVVSSTSGYRGEIRALQDQVAEYRDVLECANVVATIGAFGPGQDDAGRAVIQVRFQLQQLLALATPVMLQQGGYSEDDDIQKTADNQAENNHPCQ